MRTCPRPLLAISIALAAAAAACGADLEPPGDDDPTPPDGYVHLIGDSWTLAPGKEGYLCVRLTAAADMLIRSIRPVAPLGTHHTVLMLGPRDGADGTVSCGSSLTKPAIYASGVGTETLDLPPGVAVRVRTGEQLLLNLHLFNGSDSELTGTSGIEVATMEEADVEHEAGVVLIGKAQGLVIPPTRSTQTGRCTTPPGATVFAVAPHMHMLGEHMKVSYANAGGGGAQTLHDEEFDFDAQKFHLISPPVVTGANGKITVDCTYFNPTSETVYFGESSTQEMCYALAFVYPPPPGQQCVQ